MSQPAWVVTAEVLFELPDATRYELVRGVPGVCEPPGGAHGRLVMQVGPCSTSTCSDSGSAPSWSEPATCCAGIHVRSVAALLAAYRGRRAEAREHLAVLEREDPLGEDAFSGQLPAINVARAYAVLGDREAATRHLQRLLSVPSEFTVRSLGTDPAWKPLRGYPSFERLLR